jgi:hypothetical protein
MSPKASDLAIISIFSFLAMALEVYLVTAYGIVQGETLYLVMVTLVGLIGFLSLGYIVADYLETRLLQKYRLEVPLLASLIVLFVQTLMYLWVFSISIHHPIFIGRTLDAHAFSVFMSFLIPSLIVLYLSKE